MSPPTTRPRGDLPVNRVSLTHGAVSALLRELHTLVARDRATTATLLAHLAEVDARRLYAPAGYPSMFAWCVAVLRFSEDAACNRIRVARTARRHRMIFAMLAEGRLSLTAVVMLAPYLTEENAEGLLAAAVHQSKAGIQQLLAGRFPRADLPERIEPLFLTSSRGPSTPERMVEPAVAAAPASDPMGGATAGDVSVPERMKSVLAPLPPGPAGPPVRARVAQLAPGRFGVQFTFDEDAYRTLCEVQALLGHAAPAGDVAAVIHRALAFYKAHLEKRKYAATGRPHRHAGRGSVNPRYIPAEVKRAVWQRDGGQCTFVTTTGRRCTARTRLEYDHVAPVARGGRATAGNLRLRCRAHNQYAAECEFGAGFMSWRRERVPAAARRHPGAAGAGCSRAAIADQARAGVIAADEEARRRAATANEARAHAGAAGAGCNRAAIADGARAGVIAADEEARRRAAAAAEVVPWLRALGLRSDEARRAAARCEGIPDAPLEQRVRAALSSMARGRRHR